MKNHDRIFSFVITFVLIICFSGCISEKQLIKTEGIISDTVEINNEIKKFLGNEIIKIIKSSDSIQSFIVKSFKEAENNNTINGYPITFTGPLLTNKQIDTLQKIIFNKDAYDFENSKLCLFTPNVAFKIYQKREVVDLLISFDCYKWCFIYNGENFLIDFNPKKAQLTKFVKEIFPNNEYIINFK